MTNNPQEENKTLAVVSYLTIIGSVIAIIMNNEKKSQFIAFHNRQGLGLCLMYMIIGYFISQFDNWQISTAFWVGMGLLFFYGIISAINGKMQTVPLVGAFFQKIFSSIGK
ncbi:hypothetical protein C7H62_2535 [Mesoflavibacter sp. HG96]|uniref:Import component protein n=1 Tax=Mesoflavibacter profundi TaxID=2708110 RepID=A0ABT4RY01_9FLAO|nr:MULTISPECIES: hypothetical protein [Mesoflavibacter]MDA0176686.1 hypothetical protein [Mesoflavibacter profundi]QIJ90343.1 hypothetical protein C7H62_2535 [Mesoflavibacter sp. HG96]QIJ93071.1 hypothetical protein C7H56_2535 [Mesoflavibacter sp. HG37]